MKKGWYPWVFDSSLLAASPVGISIIPINMKRIARHIPNG
jgi:hypothetical protein